MEEKKEKKSISEKTAVKGLINGFVSYGILMLFIFISTIVLVTWLVNNHKNNVDYDVLKYSLSAIASIVIFFLVKGVCNLSTVDLFKKCKVNDSDIEKISGKMNLFYICCVLFSAVVIIVYLLTIFHNKQVTLQINVDNYYSSIESKEFADYLSENDILEFEKTKSDTLINTIIIESGFVLGIFSLIPSQQKLIKRYN